MDSVPEFEHVSRMGEWTHQFVGPESFARIKTDAIFCDPHCGGVVTASEPMVFEVIAPSLSLYSLLPPRANAAPTRLLGASTD